MGICIDSIGDFIALTIGIAIGIVVADLTVFAFKKWAAVRKTPKPRTVLRNRYDDGCHTAADFEADSFHEDCGDR